MGGWPPSDGPCQVPLPRFPPYRRSWTGKTDVPPPDAAVSTMEPYHHQ